MKLLTANRANKLLYNFIKANNLAGKVLLPANVCPDVVKTLEFAGMTCSFIDLQVDTLCINQEVVLSQVQDASMLLFVHTLGIERDFAPFFAQVREANADVVIVDDRCLCLPDLELQESAADLVLYSTGENKMINLYGGAIGYLADKWQYDEIAVEGCDVLSNELWLLDSKQLSVKMDAIIAHKEKLNSVYRSKLPAHVQLPDAFQHWRFNILVQNKDAVVAALAAEGLEVGSDYGVRDAKCVVASNLSTYVVHLYNDKHYTLDQAAHACDVINACL